MAQTNAVNRVYIMIGGKPIATTGLVKNSEVNVGTMAQHVQTMTLTGDAGAVMDTNTAPTIRWSETIVFGDQYVDLLALLRNSFIKPTVLVPEFKFATVQENRVTGRVHMLTNCTLANFDSTYPDQATEATRLIALIGISYSTIQNIYDVGA